VEALPIGQREANDGDRRAAGVDQNIVDGRAAGGDERLVVFIRSGVEGRHEDGHAGAPPIGDFGRGFVLGDCTPEQDAEDGILCEVSAFADEEMNPVNSLHGHVREKVQQDRDEEPAGMLGGEGIRGGSENHGHPAEDRNPAH